MAHAASACPSAEKELLHAARTETVRALKDKCSKVVASATDELEHYRAVHKRRAFRNWTDTSGTFWIQAAMTSRIWPGSSGRPGRAGLTESREAYGADALVAMARDRMGSSQGPRATVLVMASDCYLKVLLTKGVDVMTVAKAGRTIPASLRTALEHMYPTCAMDGCDAREGLEIDHRFPYAEGGATTMQNLARLCHRHHLLKTHCGYRLVGGPGHWDLIGPDPPG